MSAIWKALPGLTIALLGVGLAYLFFEVSKVAPLITVAVVFIIGWSADRLGQKKLDDGKPVGSLIWLELGALRRAIFAAFLVGAGIWAAVEFEPSATATVENKKLLAAMVAALAAFLTAVLVKSAEDIDGNWLAPRVQSLFKSKLREPLSKHEGSPNFAQAEQALESGLWQGRGWGWSDRRQRAKAIAAAL